MGPGECRVVAEIKANSKEDLPHTLTATSVTENLPDGLVLIDSSCSENCEDIHGGAYATLTGNAGAIAKFYFRAPNSWTAGGHGGTGTLTFSED
jgi:hypothetical protein